MNIELYDTVVISPGGAVTPDYVADALERAAKRLREMDEHFYSLGGTNPRGYLELSDSGIVLTVRVTGRS